MICILEELAGRYHHIAICVQPQKFKNIIYLRVIMTNNLYCGLCINRKTNIKVMIVCIKGSILYCPL